MSVIVLWQVFVRFVLNWNNSWTELTAILIMSWFIFLGAAVGVRENYHLGFDVLIYVLPKGSKKILRTISDVVVLAFAIGMVIYGIELMRSAMGGAHAGARHLGRVALSCRSPRAAC